jgi:hypothetical protein
MGSSVLVQAIILPPIGEDAELLRSKLASCRTLDMSVAAVVRRLDGIEAASCAGDISASVIDIFKDVQVNDEGAAVRPAGDMYYCGRRMDVSSRIADLNDDGCCSPRGRRQCTSCGRYQGIEADACERSAKRKEQPSSTTPGKFLSPSDHAPGRSLDSRKRDNLSVVKRLLQEEAARKAATPAAVVEKPSGAKSGLLADLRVSAAERKMPLHRP